MPKETQKKILIVENELPMARALGFKLEYHKFKVDIAHNGVEALAFLEKTSTRL